MRKGKIVGKVTDADTGQPIMGALVSWNPYAPSAVTNSSGNFELTFVDPGTQSVTVRLIGYEISTQTCVVLEGGTTTLNFILEPEEVGDFAGKWVGPYSSTASKRYQGCDNWCNVNTTGEMTMFMNQSGTEVWCRGDSGSSLTNYYSFIPWGCEGSDCWLPETLDISLSAAATGNILNGLISSTYSFTATRTGNTLNGSFWFEGENLHEDSTFSLIKQ